MLHVLLHVLLVIAVGGDVDVWCYICC